MFRRTYLFVVLAILFFGLTSETQPVLADLNPLPPLPSQDAINRVIAAGGPTFIPLAIPARISDTLHSAYQYAPFNQLVSRLDMSNAAYYFDLSGKLRQGTIPTVGAMTSNLAPDMLAPDGTPAKGLGALYEADKGSTLALLMFNGSAPAGVRFYATDTIYAHTLSYFTRHFTNSETSGDVGVLIAAHETCWTIGANQACFRQNDAIFDNTPSAIAEQAAHSLASVYMFHATFEFDAAVPALIGRTARLTCFNHRKETCLPNIVYTNSTTPGMGKIIGVASVLTANDFQVFDTTGVPVNQLPVDNYLIVQTTTRHLGASGVLFFIGASGHNFLIAAQAYQGFGVSGSNYAGQAAIKNSNLMWWGF